MRIDPDAGDDTRDEARPGVGERDESTRGESKAGADAASAGERDASSKSESRVARRSLSRRGFVLAGGAITATALTGKSTGRKVALDTSVDIAATEPYRAAVRDVVRAFEDADVGVRLRMTERATLDGADVHVSGRPRGSIDSGGPVRGAAIHGLAALSHAEREWRESLRTRELDERWAGDAPVETWFESDWERAASIGRAGGTDETSTRETNTDGEASARTDRDTGAVSRTLIRGNRSYQYASGFGGVGYYEVARDAVEAISPDPGAGRGPSDRATRPERAAKSRTPIVRVGYVRVDGESIGREGVRTFLRFYDRYAATDPSAVATFAASRTGGPV